NAGPSQPAVPVDRQADPTSARAEMRSSLFSLVWKKASAEQTQLLRCRRRRAEVLRGGVDLGRIEAEPLAGDLEAAADHPGDRPLAGHAGAEGRVVILAVAHVPDEPEDVAIAVGK